ncbi:MAG: flagellar biosynthetic protein FliO [Candidatus Kapaibacteriales bacterium]
MNFLTSLLTIGTLLVFIVMFSFFIRRFTSERKIGEIGLKFKVLTKLPLNSKSQLFIIQIGNRYLLIGASENNVSALADLTKVIPHNENNSLLSINQNINSSSKNQPISLSFKDFIKDIFKKSKN